METDYVSVTEIAGDEVSREQIERLCNRYFWAGTFCEGKDVVEVACGTGPGLGYLKKKSKNFEAGDCSEPIVEIAKRHYQDRVKISVFDAHSLPFKDNSKDIIIIFEAIYYLENVKEFIVECKRVLRQGGYLLVVAANKDLYDFNPSPFSKKDYGVFELNSLLVQNGFITHFYGDSPFSDVPTIQKILRPIKRMAVLLNLIPKTMGGKKFFKKLVFGTLVNLPAEIDETTSKYCDPVPIKPTAPDRRHKVIFCAAKLENR